MNAPRVPLVSASPRRSIGRTLDVLAAAVLATGLLASFASAVTHSSSPRPRAASVRDLPGYQPLVDPESASVVLGRRANAPLVSMPFAGGARSLEALVLAVNRSLHRVDRDSLDALCVTADEFRVILWPEFPQSRPATGLQWEDGWRILFSRLRSGCMQGVADYGGHVYELQSVRADSVARYRNFTLHSSLRIVVKDDVGKVQEWRWLRAVAERKGRFKIYSTDD